MINRQRTLTVKPGIIMIRPPFILLCIFCFFLQILPVYTAEGNDLYLNENGPLHVRFEALNLDDGLSQSTVNTIVQDRQGFLWFGTQDGLNRYDGYKFKIYREIPGNRNSLSQNFIWCIFIDKKGVMWIGTDFGGLNRFDPSTGDFTRYRHKEGDPHTLSHDHINCISGERGGILWIGTRSGFNRMDTRSGQIQRFSVGDRRFDKSGGNAIRAILKQPFSGNLWIGTPGGLLRMNRRSGRTRYYDDASIQCLYMDRSGYLWVGTNFRGVYRLTPQTGEIKRFPRIAEISPGISIRTIFQDKSGIMWIGSDYGGMFRLDPQTGSVIHYTYDSRYPSGLHYKSILSIYQDRGGIFWFGARSGIDKWDPRKSAFGNFFHLPNNPNSLSSGTVLSILERKDGQLWFGTYSGLNRYDAKTGKFTHYHAKPGKEGMLSNNAVLRIVPDPWDDNIIWIGTRRGLNRFDIEKERFDVFFAGSRHQDGPGPETVVSILPNRDRTLWVGTADSGLFHFNPTTGEEERFPHEPGNRETISDNFIFFIHPKGDHLWLGTSEGLDRFSLRDKKVHRYLQVRDKEKRSRVVSIHGDPDGVLWVGTLGSGLVKFDLENGMEKRYGREQGLTNGVIYGILPGEKGNLWLSTNNGLFRFNRSTGHFDHFTGSDGLGAPEFNTFAYHRGPSGRLYFGNVEGVTFFYPGKVKSSRYMPPVVITGYREFNREKELKPPVSSLNGLTLSHKTGMFSFEFSALDYSSPGKNRYAYRLEGFDQDWIATGSSHRLATYTNLDPGAYVFRVKGSSSRGEWSTAQAHVTIEITPPLWGTSWFRLAVAAVILILVFMAYRFRVRSIKASNRQLEQLVRERTVDLQTKSNELQHTNSMVRAMNVELKLAKERAEKERLAAQEANRSKSDFLARMSHEIRTPMNSIIGFTDLLMRTNLDDEQADFMRTVHRSGEALLSLINDILDFSRVEAGLLSLETIPFSPADIAREACKTVQPRLTGKPVILSCQCDPGVPAEVNGDPGRFRQVLLNLLGNAVKFTEKGEIDITVEMSGKDDNSVTLRVTVEDTGIGIEEEKLDSVFQLFHQADASISREYGGSGLGLPICKQIALLMKGDVTVESEVGKGSRFVFTSVMSRVAEPGKSPQYKPGLSAEAITAKLEQTGEGLSILMAEDNSINRKLATHLILRAGHRLEVVDNGKKAVDLFTAYPGHFDLILMDVRMPVMDGIEAVQTIRARGFSEIPVVALTAQSIKGDREKCLEAGMNDYISKPLRINQFLALLKKWGTIIKEKEDGEKKTGTGD